MTISDPIGDMLTRIRNGQQRLLAKVEMPSSTLRLKILEVLKTEGFITSFYIIFSEKVHTLSHLSNYQNEYLNFFFYFCGLEMLFYLLLDILLIENI